MTHLGELLSAYLDGELTADELDRVANHLADCERCIGEFRDLQSARVAVRLLPRMELPEKLCETIGVEPAHLGALLSAYLDGELSSEQVDRVNVHVSTCGHCSEELRELDAARSAVRSMPTLEFQVNELSEVAEVAELPVRRRWLRVAAVAAAFAALVGAGSALTPPATNPTTVDLDSLTARHAARISLDNGVAVVPAALTEAGE
ncbi:MAG: zf-HC2 domain-containing protein [Acidimicrobiia bacterium]|nr:zf-HC2 domain-containing protein [Acidimicrobiia bacterium]